MHLEILPEYMEMVEPAPMSHQNRHFILLGVAGDEAVHLDQSIKQARTLCHHALMQTCKRNTLYQRQNRPCKNSRQKAQHLFVQQCSITQLLVA